MRYDNAEGSEAFVGTLRQRLSDSDALPGHMPRAVR